MSQSKSIYLTVLRTCMVTVAALFILPQSAHSQIGQLTKSDSELKLAADSPFRDPDVIYLDADDLENDQANGILTASGEVEGRYQDKTLRADKVVYHIATGRVIAQGNVVLIHANGSTQYADKLELSDELEAGTAANFLARFPQGGQLASAFAARNTKNGVELYNAYYTACEACKENGKTKKPTWRIKARKVTQDATSNSIRYRDAIFEFKGVPLFYTPYLAHPDPSVGRASGWLVPFGGASGNKGINFRAPYYFALSPSSELTVTPHIYQKTNPLLHAQYRKKFYSGEFNLEGSLTYASFFDNQGQNQSDGITFTDPQESLGSKKARSHVFTNGLFNINETWKWGFEAGYATDDNYLDRYDFEENRPDFGLYQADNRRLMQQAFLVGQDDSFRFSASAFGLVSLRTSIREAPLLDANGAIVRNPITNAIITDPNLLTVTREDDSALPVIAPKVELTKYITDPLGGRLKLFADTTVLTRQNALTADGEKATGYIRATGGIDWQKNWIAPAGIEIKPFANAKYDFFQLEAADNPSFEFSRATGQVGLDMRWPFINAGKNVNWIIEPRVQVTQSFGDGKLGRFAFTKNNGDVVNLIHDGLDVDMDQTLLWSSNKSTGYDIWQEGLRVDAGASVIADWGTNNRAMLFLGQSFYDGSDNNAFDITSGLQEDKSDLVGQFELNIGKHFSTTTRLRYDEDDSAFRRLDTGFTYTDNRFRANVRYYKVDSAAPIALVNPDDFAPPTEEISGSASIRLIDNWSTKYQINRDIDQGITRRQALSLIYDDDCTRIELIYSKRDNGLGVIGNSDGFGIRVTLLTLGGFSPD